MRKSQAAKKINSLSFPFIGDTGAKKPKIRIYPKIHIGIENPNLHKIHISEISICTKFTLLKSHISQNSHFWNIQNQGNFWEKSGFCPSVLLPGLIIHLIELWNLGLNLLGHSLLLFFCSIHTQGYYDRNTILTMVARERDPKPFLQKMPF